MLSVTCLSGDLPRLAALLRILRPVADEIVVAIDDRADPRLLGAATEHADRAFLVPYADPVERTLQWLHEQTTGDWVFRIDDDEVPSRALLAALAAPPEDVTHCFVSRRCLWRDGWLDVYPWQPEWQLRLARRDALAFPGVIHEPSRPRGRRATSTRRSGTSTWSSPTARRGRRRSSATPRCGRACASPGASRTRRTSSPSRARRPSSRCPPRIAS